MQGRSVYAFNKYNYINVYCSRSFDLARAGVAPPCTDIYRLTADLNFEIIHTNRRRRPTNSCRSGRCITTATTTAMTPTQLWVQRGATSVRVKRRARSTWAVVSRRRECVGGVGGQRHYQPQQQQQCFDSSRAS